MQLPKSLADEFSQSTCPIIPLLNITLENSTNNHIIYRSSDRVLDIDCVEDF